MKNQLIVDLLSKYAGETGSEGAAECLARLQQELDRRRALDLPDETSTPAGKKKLAEDQSTVASWRLATFGRAARAHHVLGRFLDEVAEVVELLGFPIQAGGISRAADVLRKSSVEMPEPPAAEAGPELADCLAVLYGLADHLGVDLHAALDAKMAVNRAREWDVEGPGLGRHRG